MTELVQYEAACRAIATAKTVDEAKDIRDAAVAMQAYARQAKNKDMEADCAEIRLRASRKLDQLVKAQKATVGLNKGAAAGGQKDGPRGVLVTPRDTRPTLAEAGIDKNLAKEVRKVGALADDEFEDVVTNTRSGIKSGGIAKNVIKQKTKKTDRAKRETALADKIKALPTEKFGAILADPEWHTETWSEKGMDRAADNHYPTSTLEVIKARDVPSIAAKDCALFLWTTVPHLEQALEVMKAWGFTYKSMLTWDKEVIGNGKWLRNQTEHLIIATKGNIPAPVDDLLISSLYRERKTEHSRKPEAIAAWIERLYPNIPKIELNRRGPAREGWSAWGNEAEEDAA